MSSGIDIRSAYSARDGHRFFIVSCSVCNGWITNFDEEDGYTEDDFTPHDATDCIKDLAMRVEDLESRLPDD